MHSACTDCISYTFKRLYLLCLEQQIANFFPAELGGARSLHWPRVGLRAVTGFLITHVAPSCGYLLKNQGPSKIMRAQRV